MADRDGRGESGEDSVVDHGEPRSGSFSASLQVEAQAGYAGFVSRADAEAMLKGREQGAYLWRVSRNAAGAVLSVRGRNIVEHHVFSSKGLGHPISMNGKALSRTCYTLGDVLHLLSHSTEQSTVLLGQPVVDGVAAGSQASTAHVTHESRDVRDA